MVYCHEGHEMRILTSPPPESAKCCACARSFVESSKTSYYTCTDCDIMIHEKCVELPKQIDHPKHPDHSLVLLAKPPYDSETCKCHMCKKQCKNFVYHCFSCMFDVDVLCAMSEDEDIMILTHHHSLRVIRRPAIFECDACGVKKWCNNESYLCTKKLCGFWIHKECGSLPEFFKRPDHDHPLLLATSVPDQYRKYKFTCELCPEKLGSKLWIYYCRRCKYFIHLKCIAAEAQWYDARISSHNVPSFEMIRELKTIMSVIHMEEPTWLAEKGHVPEIKVDSHKHSLTLNLPVSNQLGDHEDDRTCDACIEPISSPYYECTQHCNFFLHTACAVLSGHALKSHYEWANMKELYIPKSPWEVVKCYSCNSFCNGYTYNCNVTFMYGDGFTASLDIKCLFFLLVRDIVHIGHKHHLRITFYGQLREFTCCCCGETKNGCCFHCSCGFVLGFECLVLPATVKHRWEKHSLILSFPPHIHDTDQGEEFYCEVCEDEIHPKHWMYRCVECDHSFHPRCIPTLGDCRNIKFGKTVSIKSHPHQLTLVPQAKLTSQCHSCRKLLYWSRAFECAACGFYLCPDCIPKHELVVDLSD